MIGFLVNYGVENVLEWFFIFNTIKIFQTKDTIKLLNNYNFLPQELIEKVKKLWRDFHRPNPQEKY